MIRLAIPPHGVRDHAAPVAPARWPGLPVVRIRDGAGRIARDRQSLALPSANPDLWLAAILREWAEAMTEPSLHYARALRRVVHPSPMPGPKRLQNMLREHRRVQTEAEMVASVP